MSCCSAKGPAHTTWRVALANPSALRLSGMPQNRHIVNMLEVQRRARPTECVLGCAERGANVLNGRMFRPRDPRKAIAQGGEPHVLPVWRASVQIDVWRMKPADFSRDTSSTPLGSEREVMVQQLTSPRVGPCRAAAAASGISSARGPRPALHARLRRTSASSRGGGPCNCSWRSGEATGTHKLP